MLKEMEILIQSTSSQHGEIVRNADLDCCAAVFTAVKNALSHHFAILLRCIFLDNVGFFFDSLPNTEKKADVKGGENPDTKM